MQLKMNDLVTTRVLMVCLGNICRSPLAEGVMRDLIHRHQLSDRLEVDSAGTSNFHVGKFPDQRSLKVALNHGFRLEHRGRQLSRGDFKRFDHILVMDESNLENALKLAKTPEEKNKIQLITDYDGRVPRPKIVADPYWGDIEDFENVYVQLLHCCEGFLKKHFLTEAA